MSKAKHTPGPWEVSNLLRSYGSVYVRADRNFVRVYDEWGSEEMQLANARLIASAPELLEALEGLLCWCQGYEADKLNPHAFSHMESARAAIAKATGEQP